MAIWTDDFDDNDLDLTKWAEVIAGTGVVTEQNQRLECNVPNANDVAGVVTDITYDLTLADITIVVNNDTTRGQILQICLTKTTNSNPGPEADWYRILKYNGDNKCMVQRRIAGGGVPSLYDAAWTGAGGSLRIVISGGTISFYEEANLRYSEAYALGSYDCYTYLFVYGGDGDKGIDVFDDWSLDYYTPPPLAARASALAVGPSFHF